MLTNLTRKRFFEIDLPVVLRTAKVFFSRPETQLRLVIYAQCLFTVILFCLVHVGFQPLTTYLVKWNAMHYWVQFLSLVPVISVCLVSYFCCCLARINTRWESRGSVFLFTPPTSPPQ